MLVKQIRTIVVDDDKDWHTILEILIKIHPKLDFLGSFTSPIAAYELIANGDVDLILLDIEMPDINGLEFVRHLVNPPLVIFVTTHPQFAAQSYEVNSVDYLVKPITVPRFLQAIEKVMLKHTERTSNTNDESYFFIRENNSFVRIEVDKVLYLKSMENYTQIVTSDKNYTTLMSLTTVAEHLPPSVFQRVHRSYVVNLSKATSVNTSDIFINEIQIPLSHTFSEKVIDKLLKGHLLTKGA